MGGKLTQRDRNNIILRFKRNEKISDLAKRYEVSRQTISHLIHEYQENRSIPQEKKAGQKRVELSESEKELIRNSLNECHMKADRLEIYIRKKTGRRISHNKIHSYLLSLGISFENARKKKQRKYRKYQRGHSMTLWHTDWKEFRLNGERSKKTFTTYASELNKLIKYTDRKEITGHTRKQYEAIAAIYAELQKKRKHVNTTDLMVEINSIISSHLEILPTAAGDEPPRRFDISAIDFGR